MGIMMIIRMYQVVGELTIIKEAMSKSRAVQRISFCETRSTCVKMKLDRTLRQRLSWRSVQSPMAVDRSIFDIQPVAAKG